MKFSLVIFFALVSNFIFAQSKSDSIKIRGVGSYYKNALIELYQIEDYITFKESLLARTTVDSTGYFEFKLKKIPTQKVVIRSKKNSSYIYVQPGGNYLITIPEKNEYESKNPNGNHVDVIFYKLDSTDINYKVLKFDRFIEKELGDFYHIKKINSTEYERRYSAMKKEILKRNSKDTNLFFLYHVKYSLAEMDDLESVTGKTRSQKFVQFITGVPMYYRSNNYMNYLNVYFENLISNVSNQVKDDLYDAVIFRSPTLAMKALSSEKDLKNIQLRELALIKLLYEQSYENRYPKTNLIFILDSLKTKSKFSEHRKIAENVLERISDLSVNSKFPEFNLVTVKGDTISNQNLDGKHVYFHFYDPNDEESQKAIQPLFKLYQNYSDYIHFVTISLIDLKIDKFPDFPWNTVCLSEADNFMKLCNIKVFPSYILLDESLNILANPALHPVPNGSYETIELVFFQIKRQITGER
jgi:hypothetical protein